jgi:DNA-binding CsgD family transcriptional regulator
LLFGDRRETAPDLPRHQTIVLSPLRLSAAKRLVRLQYPEAPAPVVEEIVLASAGSPFVLDVLSRAARADRAMQVHETEGSVETVIASRLARCSGDARRAARLLSILEPPVELETIARTMKSTTAATATALMELNDLVSVEDGIAAFRHASIADATRSTVDDPVSSYRALLESFNPDETRAVQLGAMLRCARGAGDAAAVAALALRISRVLSAAGMLNAALHHVSLAVDHAERPLPVEYAVEYAGLLQQLMRENEAALFLRGQIQHAIEKRDSRRSAALLYAYVGVAVSLELETEFAALCERAADVTRADPDASQIVWGARLAALAAAGRIDDATKHLAGGVPRWNEGRYVAVAAALRGDDDAAQRAFERYTAGLNSQNARSTTSDRAMSAHLRMFSVGNSALDPVDATWPADGETGSYTGGTVLRLLSRINSGRWDEADRIISDLPLHHGDVEEPYALLDARLLFAGVAGRAPHMPERSLSAIRRLVSTGRVRHAIAGACWLLVTLDPAVLVRAADIKAFAGDHLDVSPMPYLIGGIPLAVARLSSVFGRETCREALQRRPRYRSRWHVAHDALAHGVLEGDHVALRTARDAFDALGAPAFAMLAGIRLPVPRAADAALAQKLGIEIGRGAPTVARTLTTREQDVAELAAGGSTNREIAARLAITERTVEAHLGAAFRKLSVRSRAELASVLLRRSGRVETERL